jgi:TonB family protein
VLLYFLIAWFGLQAPSEPVRISADEALENTTKWHPVERDYHLRGRARVWVRVVVDENGGTESLKIEGGNPMSYHRVLEALRNWHYRPFVRNGKKTTVSFDLLVPIEGGSNTTLPDIRAANPPKAARTTKILRIRSLHRRPQTMVEPTYPADAKKAGIQGTVSLRIVIGHDGEIQEAEPISGPPALRSAAVTAVKQWRYEPFLLNEQPVRVETEVSVRFKLEKNS